MVRKLTPLSISHVSENVNVNDFFFFFYWHHSLMSDSLVILQVGLTCYSLFGVKGLSSEKD